MTALDVLDPRRCALLVIDMQNAFCHPDGTLGRSGLDTDRLGAVVPAVRASIEAAQQAGLPVIWTIQEHLPEDRRRARKRLPSHTSKRKGVSALAGTWDAAIIDALADLLPEPTFIIRKHRFGAFHETRLEILLQQLGVDALFITGLTTNACVETTIREAYLRDYDVIALTDCIAGVNPEWEAPAMAVWQHYLAALAPAAEFIALCERHRAPRTIGIGHILLEVSDLAVAEHFYLDLLGMQRKPDAKPLPDGRTLTVTRQGLGLTPGRSGEGRQLDHMAFEVANVEALDARLRAAGVRFDRELGPGPYGLSIYVFDPDNNLVELYEPGK